MSTARSDEDSTTPKVTLSFHIPSLVYGPVRLCQSGSKYRVKWPCLGAVLRWGHQSWPVNGSVLSLMAQSATARGADAAIPASVVPGSVPRVAWVGFLYRMGPGPYDGPGPVYEGSG